MVVWMWGSDGGAAAAVTYAPGGRTLSVQSVSVVSSGLSEIEEGAMSVRVGASLVPVACSCCPVALEGTRPVCQIESVLVSCSRMKDKCLGHESMTCPLRL